MQNVSDLDKRFFLCLWENNLEMNGKQPGMVSNPDHGQLITVPVRAREIDLTG